MESCAMLLQTVGRGAGAVPVTSRGPRQVLARKQGGVVGGWGGAGAARDFYPWPCRVGEILGPGGPRRPGWCVAGWAGAASLLL